MSTIIDGGGTDPIVQVLANGAGTEVARITSAGDVGIGTATPTRKLEVNGFAKYKVPAVKADRSSPQTIPASTETVVSWPSEIFDNDNLHSDSTNPSRLTASEAGIWAIGCNILWGTVAGDSRQVTIRRNGGSYIANIKQFATGTSGMAVSVIFSLAASDYVEVTVTQDTASDVDVVATTSSFWMYKISD